MSDVAALRILAEESKSCTDCGLSARRRNVVFGEGNLESPLVIVGEGPGDKEDESGRPFVGAAGQLLDRALLDNGLDRTDVYICNVVKCRACDWKNDTPFNRAPTPDEVAACSQWLEAQLRAIAPKVILCIGSPSSNTIIRKGFQITKERGQEFECRYAPVAIGTLHPAYVLRQNSKTHDGGYSLIVQDIGTAWRLASQ